MKESQSLIIFKNVVAHFKQIYNLTYLAIAPCIIYLLIYVDMFACICVNVYNVQYVMNYWRMGN